MKQRDPHRKATGAVGDSPRAPFESAIEGLMKEARSDVDVKVNGAGARPLDDAFTAPAQGSPSVPPAMMRPRSLPPPGPSRRLLTVILVVSLAGLVVVAIAVAATWLLYA